MPRVHDAARSAQTMKALLPLAWVYGAGVALDRHTRSVPKLAAGAVPQIIAVGNLEAGGNGKTPLAMLLLNRAGARGARAAYVSRGYGGHSVGAQVVTCVLAGERVPAALAGKRILSRSHPNLAREVGDEGALVTERAPEASAFFCTSKPRAVRAAMDLGVDCIVLDDAFQSWPVARHTDIVLLDAERPFDAGCLLPAGRLREKPDALARANALVMNGAATREELDAARAKLGKWLPAGIPVAGLARRIAFVTTDGATTSPPQRLVAVSSIARPDGFRRSLAAAGTDIIAHEIFPDHHLYKARDVERMLARLERERAAGFVTTEKDWVKLRALDIAAPVVIARLDVSLIGDELPGV